LIEPLKILASSDYDDERERSLSPEVASEKDSFIDQMMEPPESSRVVEDNSDSHHKFHHMPLTANVKGTTLKMRNMQSNIKLPHATH